MTNNSKCHSLNYEEGLRQFDNNQELYIQKMREFDLYYLNESLLKLNKTYLLNNLSDFEREAKILSA